LRWRLLICIGIALLSVGWLSAEAAYRLSFKNGTSVEVSSYEDLGDAVRYPRLGGTVTVPKAHLLGIEEAVHLPGPEKPTPQRPPAPSPPGPLFKPEPPAPPPPTRPPVTLPPFQLDPFFFVWPFLSVPAPVFLVALAALVVMFGLRHLIRGHLKLKGLPYTKVPAVLTTAEQVFYSALRQAVGEQWAVLAKVRLSDVIDVPFGAPDRQAHRNRIDRKHLDFVLCSRADCAPALAIELDDSSHERFDRRRRDAFVDSALGAAGLLILRVPVRLVYD